MTNGNQQVIYDKMIFYVMSNNICFTHCNNSFYEVG